MIRCWSWPRTNEWVIQIPNGYRAYMRDERINNGYYPWTISLYMENYPSEQMKINTFWGHTYDGSIYEPIDFSDLPGSLRLFIEQDIQDNYEISLYELTEMMN